MAYNKRQGLGLPFLRANIGKALIEIKGSLFEDSDVFNTGDVRPQNLFGSLFEDSDTFRGAILDAPAPGTQSILRSTFLNSSSLFHGLVRPTNTFGSFLEDSDTLNDGEVGGSRQLEGHDHNNQSILYHGKILLDLQELDGSLLTDADTLHHGATSPDIANIQGSKPGDSILVLDSVTTNSATIESSHSINIPNGSNQSDRMLIVAVSSNNSVTYTWPSGWVESLDTTTGDVSLGIAYKTIDGTEGFSGSNDTITVTTSESKIVTAIAYLVNKNPGIIWDLDTFSFSNKSAEVTPQLDFSPVGLYFRSDGTRMYVAGSSNTVIAQYDLSIPWDVSTASGTDSYDYTPDATQNADIFISKDGTQMFLLEPDLQDIYSYTLSTAWDVTTASYDSKSFSTSSQAGSPNAMHFKPDGTKLYIAGESGTDSIYQYSLSTAFDLDTVTYDNKSVTVGTVTRGIRIDNTGTKMFVLDSSADTISSYTLSTAWDISTATSDSVTLDVSSEDISPLGLYVRSTGENLYISAGEQEEILQYDGSSLTAIEVNSATGNNTSPDPPSITPNFGYKNYLTIAIEAHDAGSTSTTAYPSGFVNNQAVTAGTLTTGCGIGGSHLIIPSSTQDPSTFTISQTRSWIAATISLLSTEPAFVNNVFHGSLIPEIVGTTLTDIDTLYSGTVYKGVRLTSSQRNYTAGHENPGVYTLDNSNDWIAVTIAIR